MKTQRLPLRGARGNVLLPLLVAVLLPGAALGAQERAVTLDEAIELSLVRSPQLTQSQVSLENAAEGRRTAWGSFLPSVSASTSGSRSASSRFSEDLQTTVETGGQSMSGRISAGVDLYTGGRQTAALRAAEHDLDAAEAQLEGQRFNVVLQTRQIFFQALEQLDLMGVAETRIDRAEENLELVRRRIAAGTATSSDSLRARLEVANARQAALQNRNQLRAARIALGRQIGTAGEVEPVRPASLEPATLSVPEEEIYRLAEEASPEIRAQRASAASASTQVTTARAAYLPSLSMSTGYNWSNADWGFDGGSTSWSVSLSASYPIFNGFTREANVQRARNQVRLANVQEEDARLAVREQVDGALQALRTAREAAEISDEAVLVAREDLRVVSERYEVGVATFFDVVTSQVALDEAEVARIQTRYDLLVARAEIESILGREL